MPQTPTVILVPIDNRPITYGFPQLIAANAGVKAVVPPISLMGSLEAASSLNALSEWLEEALVREKPAALFICLDSIFYGGLIPSHRSMDSLAEVMERTKQIANWKKLTGNSVQIFAQASITRIPHYNDSIEEPEYWKDYGAQIFGWSVLKHKQALGLLNNDSELATMEKALPAHVLADFTKRRQRNFQVNQSLIKLVKSGEIDYLVFSQDDTGEFGLNVLEKSQLIALTKQEGVTNIDSYAGADEVIMSLMARWFATTANRNPKVSLSFSPLEGCNILSNFEGQTIGVSLAAQMKAAKLEVLEEPSATDQDFAIVVHTAGNIQGDHVLLPGAPVLNQLDSKESVQNTISLLESLPSPIVLCDVAYTNGSDPLLIEMLLSRKDLLDKLSAYAAWNTTGNTVGSAIAIGAAQWYARPSGISTKEASKRTLFLRLADDWAYQSQVRCQLANQPSEERMRQLMAPLLKRLANTLEFDPGPLSLKLPWHRTFEVGIDMCLIEKSFPAPTGA
jgi:Protein of unknown function (DUF4127)